MRVDVYYEISTIALNFSFSHTDLKFAPNSHKKNDNDISYMIQHPIILRQFFAKGDYYITKERVEIFVIKNPTLVN